MLFEANAGVCVCVLSSRLQFCLHYTCNLLHRQGREMFSSHAIIGDCSRLFRSSTDSRNGIYAGREIRGAVPNNDVNFVLPTQ